MTNSAIDPIDLQIPGYQILSLLGKGAMAKVYLALQESLNREVALKVMAEELSNSSDYSERFLREARIVAQLSHAHIVSIYDVDVYKGNHYLSMEYHSGGDLKQKIYQGLSVGETITLTTQIASALNFAHSRGYVHRDVKPENILFSRDGQAILNDFGIAVSNEAKGRLTAVGTIIGSPKYMSPEQARGDIADARSDIYSLGVIFYEMLTGSVPYEAENPVAICQMHISNLIPQLPSTLAAYQNILDTCMAKDPIDRFSSATDLIRSLETIGAGNNKGADDDATVVSTVADAPSSNDDETIVRTVDDVSNTASPKAEKNPVSSEETNSIAQYSDLQSTATGEAETGPASENPGNNQSTLWFVVTFVAVFIVAGLIVLFKKTDILDKFLEPSHQVESTTQELKPPRMTTASKSSALMSSVTIIAPQSQSLCTTGDPYLLGRRIVTENDSLNRGECFSIQIETTDQSELIVFSHSEDGTIYRLIPNECNAMGLANKTFRAGETINFPLSGDNKIAAIGLDNRPGKEWIYVIATKDADIKQTILSSLSRVQDICIDGQASTVNVATVQHQLEEWALQWPNRMQWISKSFLHTAN